MDTTIKIDGYLEIETATTVKIESVRNSVVELLPPDNVPVFLAAGDTLNVVLIHKVDVDA